mmetsp:Transcript_97960/g.192368  ORF Transcript_97960/g.192368 Transcript_97960/m.192368 type:complete len:255 (-) Transcript_97960:13-777(-)
MILACSFALRSTASSRWSLAFSRSSRCFASFTFQSRIRRTSAAMGLFEPSLSTLLFFASSNLRFSARSACLRARSCCSNDFVSAAASGDAGSNVSCVPAPKPGSSSSGPSFPYGLKVRAFAFMVSKNCCSRNLRNLVSSFSRSLFSRCSFRFMFSRTATARRVASTFQLIKNSLCAALRRWSVASCSSAKALRISSQCSRSSKAARRARSSVNLSRISSRRSNSSRRCSFKARSTYFWRQSSSMMASFCSLRRT